MPVELTCTGGRYPTPDWESCLRGRPKHLLLSPQTIRATLTIRDGKVLLRVDDENHTEMWMELECATAPVTSELFLDYLERHSQGKGEDHLDRLEPEVDLPTSEGRQEEDDDRR